MSEHELKMTETAFAVGDVVDIGANLTKCKRPEVARQLAAAADAGVTHVVATGCDIKGSVAAGALASWHNSSAAKPPRTRLYFTAGVHPHSATSLMDANGKLDHAGLSTLEALAKSPFCVALGECGLDYNRNYSPQEAPAS